MTVKYTVKLDLTDNGTFNTGWRIKQGDFRDSVIVVKAVDNDVPYYSNTDMPRIVFKRSDGKSIIGTMEPGENNSYQYTFVGNELEIAGTVVMDVKFGSESGGRISTASCTFECVPDTISGTATPADIYPGITLEQVDTEATRVATEVSTEVATEVASKIARQSSGITFTSASPLTNSTKSAIRGIDALGKSAQISNLFVSSGYTSGRRLSADVGQTYGSNLDFVDADASTMYVSALIEVAGNGTYTRYSNAENYLYRTAFYNASKVRIGKTESKTFTVPSDCTYVAMCGYISELSATTLYGVPIPTSPIPIIDASAEVVSKTKNLFNPSNILNAHLNDDSYGVRVNDAARMAYAKCKPNTTYTVSKRSGQRFQVAYVTDIPADGLPFYGKISNPTASSISITTGANAKYLVAFVWLSSADTIPANDMLTSVQIEEGSTATSYVPYQSNTITLPYTLHSVGTVADELIINEDGSGKIVRRVGIFDLSTIDGWAKSGTSWWVKAPTTYNGEQVADTVTIHGLCSAYTITSSSNAKNVNNALGCNYNNGYYFICRNDSASTSADVKASFNGSTFYYALATPTEETLTSEQVASIRALQIYDGTTIVESEMEIASVSYSGDIKGYVDSKTDYSYTDTIIGKWSDGKDLHRMVIQTDTPSSTALTPVYSGFNSNTVELKNIGGCIKGTTTAQIPINCYINSTYYAGTWLDASGICMSVASAYTSKPCEIVVEYTLKNAAPAMTMALSLEED